MSGIIALRKFSRCRRYVRPFIRCSGSKSLEQFTRLCPGPYFIVSEDTFAKRLKSGTPAAAPLTFNWRPLNELYYYYCHYYYYANCAALSRVLF